MNLITDFGTISAIIIRAISCFTILLFVMPLLIREATVKNGLRRLRLQMLTIGFIILTTNLVSMLLAYDTLDNTPSFFHSSLQLVNAIAFLAFSIIMYLIYHQQYTPEAKEVHKKVDLAEKKEKFRQDKLAERTK